MQKLIIFLFLILPLMKVPAMDMLVQERVLPGEPLSIIVYPLNGDYEFLFTLYTPAGRPVIRVKGFKYYPGEGLKPLMVGLGGMPSDLSPGTYLIKGEGKSPLHKVYFEKSVDVGEKEYSQSVIKATKSMNNLRKTSKDPERVEQARRLWNVISGFNIDSLFNPGKMVLPIKEFRRSSFFGFQRVFLYPDGEQSVSVHKGADYAAETGTPVYSPGTGLVALAENRILTGNTVVIEHLPGVYSLYYHMDSLNAEVGQRVFPGDLIGTVGTTGFSTGAHLHWEMRISEIPVNPEYFLSHDLIDKRAIMNMIRVANIKKGG